MSNSRYIYSASENSRHGQGSIVFFSRKKSTLIHVLKLTHTRVAVCVTGCKLYVMLFVHDAPRTSLHIAIQTSETVHAAQY